ncbi:helix-turn-helix domain-containing protein [Saprospira grandis]|uniref:Transcriptional regulator, XRE family n=1 Tax=Saprospira grandis (strain Lewin) TaxID=984262 RepID=H6L1K7_SAPGL|nr:helix-turn-helix transcriptional regulator [Saprospira grandis]AFC24651.1 transcriptional regulator, XRE family [Saprospira grandis str. Lewin]
MKANKDKFLALVAEQEVKTSEKNKERVAKRLMLRASRDIAHKILDRLEELGWSQKQLAEVLAVSPQYVSKMVKGKENFTLETLVKVQNILDLPILANYYESNRDKAIQLIGEESTEVVPMKIDLTYDYVVIHESTDIKESSTINLKQIC